MEEKMIIVSQVNKNRNNKSLACTYKTGHRPAHHCEDLPQLTNN